MLQLQDLRVGQVKEPCIGFTQENSIESSLQSHLPYISILMVYAHYCAAYPKQPYVRNEINIYCTYYIILLLQNLLLPSIIL